MLHAIVLAAGASRRFGGAKLLADWRGAPLLHASLRTAFAAPVAAVHVVTGADAEVISACARSFAPAVQLVHASDHDEGMAASLRAGIASLPGDARGAFVFLADMPLIPADIPHALALALHGDIEAAAPMLGERSGHPVLFARSVFPALMALRGDVGAKSALAALGARVCYLPTDDEGVLRDVDTRADLREGNDDGA